MRAAVIVDELLYLAACDALDGEHVARVSAETRGKRPEALTGVGERLRALTPLRALTAAEREAFAVNVGSVTANSDAVRRAGGPEKWAARETARLLGHGAGWYRDAVERSPWPPALRRRYAPVPALEREMERHPGRFSAMTKGERLFLRLPPEARTRIADAVTKALDAEALHGPLRSFFRRPAVEREALTNLVPELHEAVRGAIDAMPKAMRDTVRARCARLLRGERKRRADTPCPVIDGAPLKRPATRCRASTQ